MNAIMMKLTTEEMKEDATDTNRIHPAVALGGCIISVMILLLLIVPGSPAFMAPQSFAALIVWVLMGVTFYFVSKKKLCKDFQERNGLSDPWKCAGSQRNEKRKGSGKRCAWKCCTA